MKKVKFQGFSLIELIFTCTILSLLLMSAWVPFSNLFHQTISKTQAMTFFHALQFARIEAIKRGQTVSVCPTSDFMHCHLQESIGYIIYTGTQTILRRESLPKNTIISFPKHPIIDFSAQGQSHTPCTLWVRSQGVSKKIVISTSGRIRMQA